MAFKPMGTLNPHGGAILRSVIVTGSVALVEEDSLKTVSGFASLGTTGALVLGHARAIVDKNGLGLLTTGVSGAEMGSYAGAFTMASDNTTVAKVAALVDISKDSLYSADPDAAVATTTGSNLLGYRTDIADEDQTDESSAVEGSAQYTIHGIDPKDSGNQVVSICESTIFGV